MATVEEQGAIVRQLKTDGASKEEITAAVVKLKELKMAAGLDVNSGGRKKKEKKKQQPNKEKKAAGAKKETGLSLSFKKNENFSEWYSQVIVMAEMIDYYDISGCYILRPWSYAIWEKIQSWFDARIKELGVQNSYFPVFVSKSALEAEADHIEGFAPEVAWVTKSGSSDLAEPIAVRPTSETIMYPAYAKWIRSHRDLPLKLNQWTNVVRWEFKHPTPFLRTREFLWQEGHSAFATKPEADAEVLDILDLYARVYEELLAVPVIKGKKSEKEKFAGGLYTTTVEALIPANGRAIQGATSHCLGQNFARMFNITFEAEDASKQMVWQNSWGLTTRTIGVCVMVHGDDKGLVLPPRVAPLQVVVVVIYNAKTSAQEMEALFAAGDSITARLQGAGVRVKFDSRKDKNPGWKYAHWEQKGVPLRLELGPRDMKNSTCVLARRDDGSKLVAPWEGLEVAVPALLEQVQGDMLRRARGVRDSMLSHVTEWEQFVPALNQGHLVLAPWCQRTECEENVKARTGPGGDANDDIILEEDMDEVEGPKGLTGAAKTLCIPFSQAEMAEGTSCFACAEAASVQCLWGRSY